jgi:phospholipid/cholesterol/gamma-HCH transport system substrate-binding protein
MAERGMRLKLGTFVAGSLAVLAALVVFFGRAPELFSNKARYSVLFPEAPGIGPGTPIRKSGVRIGEVNSLDLDPESGQVRVHIRVDRKYLPRKSEEPHITKGLLSGDAAVDFFPITVDGQPVPRAEEWPPGSEIPGVPPITPRTFLTPASGVLAGAQQSLDRVAKAFEKLEKFETVQPKLERALDEASETFKSIRTLVPEAKKTMERIQNFIGADDAAPPVGGRLGPVVPAGLLQPPADQSNLRAMIRDIQEVARAVKPAVDDMRAAIRRLEPEVGGAVKAARQTFESINDILTPENRKQVAELLKNANSVAVAIVKITTTLTTMLDAAEKAIKNIDTQVTAAGAVIGDVRAVTKPLAARSEALVTNVTDTVEQLSKAIGEVRVLMRMFGKENGTIQKLLTDPSVYQNIDDAAGSLARIMARTEKITRDLEVFADKIARRPELIGVGGAIRPSSGLKDLPGTSLPSYRPDWPPAAGARPTNDPHWLRQSNPNPPPVQGYPPR